MTPSGDRSSGPNHVAARTVQFPALLKLAAQAGMNDPDGSAAELVHAWRALKAENAELRGEVECLRDRAVCSGCGRDVGEAGICTAEDCDDGEMIPASDLPWALRQMRDQRDEFHKELMEL